MRIACENAHAFQNVLNEWELLSGTKLGVRLIMHDFRPVFCSQHGIALFDQHNTLQLMKRSSDLLKTYKALLHTLAERGVDICRARGVQVSSVAVMIQEGFDVNCDESQGVLRIGIERGVEGIVEAIQTRGGKLNMHYERQMREEQVERKRVLLIKKALRISGLRRMEGVPDWEWKEALGRLRFHASRLAVVLDGVPVAIGSQVSLLKSTGEIELPYNFNEMLDI